MPKYLQVKPHLSVEELEQRYGRAKGVTERNHYQIIWLMAQGKRSHEVAAVTGYHVERVRQIVRDYNKGGPAQVGDQRPGRGGRKRLLTAEQEAILQAEVEQAFTDGQPYTGVQVAQRMSEVLGRPVHPARGWTLLQRWQHRLKLPRRQHVKRDVAEGEAFKKT
jgi:transposase